MFNKLKWIILGVVMVAGIITAAYLYGRNSAPEKIVTKIEYVTKIVYKEKTNTDQQTDKETVVIKITMPDGTIREETHIIEKGHVVINTQTNSTTDTSGSNTTIITKNSKWKVNLLYSPPRITNVTDYKDSFGVGLEYKIFGPFYIGGFILSEPRTGLSLGIVF